VSTLTLADVMDDSLPLMSDAVNVNDEIDAIDEIATDTEELVTVSVVASTEVEAVVDTTAKDVVEEPVGEKPENSCTTNTLGDVGEGLEELIEGGHLVWNEPHLMHGYTPGVIDLEEELREKEERRVRELAEHEKSEAEGSSTLPPIMEILQLNNETGPVLDDIEVEGLFTRIVKDASEGVGLDFESSNRVKRTKTVVPGKGARAALQIVHQVSKISDEELAVAIMEWTLKKIASRKEGKK
jgi:hypothetical protein